MSRALREKRLFRYREPVRFAALLFASFLLLSCAATPRSPLAGDSPKESASKGEVRGDLSSDHRAEPLSLPALNLTFTPAPEWNYPEELSPESRSLSLYAPSAQLSAKIYGVKQSRGEGSHLDRLLETEIQGWRIGLQSEAWFQKKTLLWDGLEAAQFEIGGEGEEGALQVVGLAAWDGVNHYFVTLAHEGEGTRPQLQKEWNRFISSIERQGKYKSPELKTDFSKPVTSFSSDRLGYSIALPGGIWFDWSEVRQLIGDPEFALVNRSEDLTAILLAHRIEEGLLRPSQIFYAYLLQLGINPERDQLAVERRKLSEEKIDLRFKAVRVAHGVDFVYHGRFVWDGKRSAMIAGWSQAALEKKYRPHIEELLQAFQLTEPTTQPLNEKEKRSSALLLNQVGLTLLQSGDALSALGFFEKANRLDPEEPLYLINCGYVYQLKKLYGPGIQHFESQLPLVKTHGKLLSILGELYEASYNYSRALELYTQASQFYPDDEELRINLSDALWGVGYRKQSLEVVESLYRIRPSTRLGVYLAKTYMGLDRYAEATDLLLQLNGGRSHSKEMGNTLAISLLAQGRYQEALQVAALTIAKFGASHSLLMAQGKAQFYLKQFKPALRSFEQAKKLDDADEENISFLSATQSLLGTGDNKALQKEIAPTHPIRTPREIIELSFESKEHLEEYPALVHFREEAVHFVAHQPWRITEELLVEVQNESGLALFKEFSFSYLPGYDRLYVNLLRVYNPDLSLKWEGKLSDYYVTSEVGDGATSEHQIAHLPVKELAVGDLIHLMTTRASIEKSVWAPFVDHRASRYLPVGLDRLTLTGDLSAFQIEEYGPIQRIDKKGTIVWEAREPIILKQELYTPHYQDIAGGVMIAGARDWASIGVEYEELIKHQKRGSIAARELAYVIKGSLHNPQEIIDRTVEWVRQNISYKNIPFGGHAVVPANSGETLKRRWGDCKDKSLLAHEILATLGIPSHLVLVSLKEPVSTALPTIHQFDHMILYIPKGEKYREQYVDLTELGGVKRPVPYGLEGGAALVIDGDSSRLAIMPQVESTLEHRAVISHKVRLHENGSAEFRDQLELYGKFAAGMREKFAELNDKELHKTLQEWLSDELPGSTLLNVQLKNIDNYEKPFEIDLTYAVEKMMAPIRGNWSYLQPATWERIFMRMPRTGKRTHPIRLPNQHDFEWTLSIQLPPKWRVEAVEQKEPAHQNYIDWSHGQNLLDSTVELHARWSTHALYATPEEYAELQKEWESVLNALTPTLRLSSPE